MVGKRAKKATPENLASFLYDEKDRKKGRAVALDPLCLAVSIFRLHFICAGYRAAGDKFEGKDEFFLNFRVLCAIIELWGAVASASADCKIGFSVQKILPQKPRPKPSP